MDVVVERQEVPRKHRGTLPESALSLNKFGHVAEYKLQIAIAAENQTACVAPSIDMTMKSSPDKT
jgi:hypothetical protein